MCGGGKSPKPPAPPPTPAPAPKRVDDAVQQARADERKRLTAGKGHRGTMLTGDLAPATTEKKTLLGS